MAPSKRGNESQQKDIEDFLHYKREIVRLDFVAEQLRVAIKETQRQLLEEKMQLLEQQNIANEREKRLRLLGIEHETSLLGLEKQYRKLSEKCLELQTRNSETRLQLEQVERLLAKTSYAANELEQHKFFLTDVILHKVSPRTPSTGRTSKTDDSGKDILQNTNLLQDRLLQKEARVTTLSNLLVWASSLKNEEKFPETIKDQNIGFFETSEDLNKKENPQQLVMLNDETFAKAHDIYSRFISQHSFQDPLEKFSALENFAYQLLDIIDKSDSSQVKRIVSKVANDKKKLLVQQQQRHLHETREKREKVALERATRAAAPFQRPTVQRKQRSPSKLLAQNFVGNINDHQPEDLSYLFCSLVKQT